MSRRVWPLLRTPDRSRDGRRRPALDGARRQRCGGRLPLRDRQRPDGGRAARGVRVRHTEGQCPRARVRGQRGRPHRGLHGGPRADQARVGRVRGPGRRVRDTVLLRGRQPRHEQRRDGRGMASALRAVLLPLRLPGRAVPGAELGAVPDGGYGRVAAGAVVPGGTARLRRGNAGGVPRAPLDDRARPPAAVGLPDRTRRLAQARGHARRAGLHGLRRAPPPLRPARQERQEVHHARHHGRRKWPARRDLRRVRPGRPGDDDGRGPPAREPPARRHRRRRPRDRAGPRRRGQPLVGGPLAAGPGLGRRIRLGQRRVRSSQPGRCGPPRRLSRRRRSGPHLCGTARLQSRCARRRGARRVPARPPRPRRRGRTCGRAAFPGPCRPLPASSR